MSKFFEALTGFEHAVNSYAEGPALKEVILEHDSFEKIRWVVGRELEMSGRVDPGGHAFGFEDLRGHKGYFKCRGIKFVKSAR